MSHDWITYGPHGLIIVLLIWILKHIREVKITMKNGKGKHDDN